MVKPITRFLDPREKNSTASNDLCFCVGEFPGPRFARGTSLMSKFALDVEIFKFRVGVYVAY